MKKFLVKRKTVLICLLCIIIVFFLHIIQYTTVLNNILGFFVILFSLVWIYKCWNNNIALLVSLFIGYCNYSIIMGVYWDPTIRDNEYLYYQISDIRTYGIGVALLFLTMLYLSMSTIKYEKNNSMSNLIRKENYSIPLFVGSLAAFILCISQGYIINVGSRGGSTPLYEYGVIFLLLMFYFSGKRKWTLNTCLVITIIYSLISILNGTRVEALTCIFVFLFCFFRRKISPWVIILGMLVGILVFSTIGAIRGNWKLLELYGFNNLIKDTVSNKLVFDTCTHAYFPMLCMIEEYTPYSFSNACYYLTKFIFTIFLGQSKVIDGDLISIVRTKYYHNFGGVTLGFFYVWFGYIGAIIFSIFIKKILNWATKLRYKKNDYIYFTSTYVIAAVPRWYLYGPWAFTRGALISIILFSIFNVFFNLMRSKKTSIVDINK